MVAAVPVGLPLEMSAPVAKQCVGGRNERAILLSEHCPKNCVKISFAASF
jgi:hypothetical protein